MRDIGESIGGELLGTFSGMARDVVGVISAVVSLSVLTIALPIVATLMKQPTKTGERSALGFYYWDAEKGDWVLDPLGLGPSATTTTKTGQKVPKVVAMY